jgi:L-ascorbate metabolism protein UlaG (beta-lactamase superfamily)
MNPVRNANPVRLLGTDSALTWLGHATVLVELDGITLLTDPLLRRRAAHLVRAEPVPTNLGLDTLDVVLVSHVHFDHLDLPSLSLLPRSTTLVVPRGAARLVRRRGLEDVVEMRAGDALELGAVEVRATHAEHAASRGPLGVSAPSLGYLLTGSRTIYFAGDTGLFSEMRGLGAPLDVALLPVAGWGPRLPAGHLDPEAAATSLRLLEPKFAVPIHWRTFWPFYKRGPYAESAAAGAEFAAFAEQAAPQVDVRILEIGERWPIGAPATFPSGTNRT